MLSYGEKAFTVEEIHKKMRGRNWVATFMLCVLLGMFGAHRFYTGRIGSAITMLAFTCLIITFPITSIWCMIDFFTLAFGNYTAAGDEELYERIPWLAYLYLIFGGVFMLGILGMVTAVVLPSILHS